MATPNSRPILDTNGYAYGFADTLGNLSAGLGEVVIGLSALLLFRCRERMVLR